MKSSWGLTAINFSICIAVAMPILAGGLRGLRSPRVWGMVLATLTGGILMVANGLSWRDRKLGVVLTTAERSLFILGAVLFVGGAAIGLVSIAKRARALHRAMDRLDGYLQGSDPLPFPTDSEPARRDLATLARLLEDPVLSHRFPAVARERVAELRARALETG